MSPPDINQRSLNIRTFFDDELPNKRFPDANLEGVDLKNTGLKGGQKFFEDDFDARQAARGVRFETFEDRLSSKNYG